MSRTGSYFLARKVQQKLLRDASNPNINLRVIVTQTNMLCNLVSVIEGKKEVKEEKEIVKEVVPEVYEVKEEVPEVKEVAQEAMEEAQEVREDAREDAREEAREDIIMESLPCVKFELPSQTSEITSVTRELEYDSDDSDVASDDSSEYGFYSDSESDSDVEEECIEILSGKMMLPNVQPPTLTTIYEV